MKTKRRPSRRSLLLAIVFGLLLWLMLVALIMMLMPPVNPMFPATPCMVIERGMNAAQRNAQIVDCLGMATITP